MREALRLDRANESFGVGIQVGTSWRQLDRFYANRSNDVDELRSEEWVVVVNEIF